MHTNPLAQICDQQWSASMTSPLDAFLGVGMDARVLGTKAVDRDGWAGEKNPWQLAEVDDANDHLSGCA